MIKINGREVLDQRPLPLSDSTDLLVHLAPRPGSAGAIEWYLVADEGAKLLERATGAPVDRGPQAIETIEGELPAGVGCGTKLWRLRLGEIEKLKARAEETQSKTGHGSSDGCLSGTGRADGGAAVPPKTEGSREGPWSRGPSGICPPSSAETAPRPKRSRLPVTAVIAVVVLALVGGGVWFFKAAKISPKEEVLTKPQTVATERDPPSQKESISSPSTAPTVKPEGRESAEKQRASATQARQQAEDADVAKWDGEGWRAAEEVYDEANQAFADNGFARAKELYTKSESRFRESKRRAMDMRALNDIRLAFGRQEWAKVEGMIQALGDKNRYSAEQAAEMSKMDAGAREAIAAKEAKDRAAQARKQNELAVQLYKKTTAGDTEAEKNLRDLAETSNAVAWQCWGAVLALNPNTSDQCYDWYLKAAEAGLPEAQYMVGRCHEMGLGKPGIKKSASEAKKWYDKSAAQGCRPAVEARDRLEIEMARAFK